MYKLPVNFRVIRIAKFRQFVTAEGSPPVQTIFRAASATAIAQPCSGSPQTHILHCSQQTQQGLLNFNIY